MAAATLSSRLRTRRPRSTRPQVGCHRGERTRIDHRGRTRCDDSRRTLGRVRTRPHQGSRCSSRRLPRPHRRDSRTPRPRATRLRPPLTLRRDVRVTQQFFNRLDELFPPHRGGDGSPSATDFLLHEMPNIIEKLAVDFEAATAPSNLEPDVRVLVGSAILVPLLAVYAALDGDGGVEIFYLDIT